MEDLVALITFVRMRYDEIESIAREAKGTTSGKWSENGAAGHATVYDQSSRLSLGQHRHIAAQDPARTLRRIEALRLVVERCVSVTTRLQQDDDHAALTGAHYILHALALEFADHPGYKLEWRLSRRPGR